MSLRIDILTLFPEIFFGPLGSSIVGRAMKNQQVEINAVNLRDYAHDRRKTVDDVPYGGGPGMLMRPDILAEAVTALRREDTFVVLTGPRGKTFNQAMARDFATKSHLLFICGHYEGVDERVRQTLIDAEVSIGDYVLTSGNLAAMVMTDAIVRLLPGVLGNGESDVEESFEDHLLEYPQYTVPADWNGMKVPEVLLSGDHGKIAKWRKAQAVRLTLENRPDLLE